MNPPTSPTNSERTVRKQGVAERTGLGVRTIERLISMGKFPGADIKIGTRILLWRESTIQRWIEEQAERHKKGGVS